MDINNDPLTSKSQSLGQSILSAGTTLNGDLVGSGEITIEGTVVGNIKCRCLTLNSQQTTTGSVEAEVIHVGGNFIGELRATKVVLSESAKMRGDIYSESLEIQPGAEFEGKVERLRSGSTEPTDFSEASDLAAGKRVAIPAAIFPLSELPLSVDS